MNQKLARAVLLQGAKDMLPSWGQTADARKWCEAAGISVQDYREALQHLAKVPATQRQVLMKRLRHRLGRKDGISKDNLSMAVHTHRQKHRQ